MKLTKAQEWMLIYSQAVSDSWKDKELRAKLLSDPAKTLKEYYNYTVPPDIQLEFKETNLKTHPDYSSDTFEVFNDRAKSKNKRSLSFSLSGPPEPFVDIFNKVKNHATPYGIKCACACL